MNQRASRPLSTTTSLVLGSVESSAYLVTKRTSPTLQGTPRQPRKKTSTSVSLGLTTSEIERTMVLVVSSPFPHTTQRVTEKFEVTGFVQSTGSG